jgi:hypothetical protein
MYSQKFVLWVTVERILYMQECPHALIYAVRNVPNNTYNEKDPLHGFHASQILILWICSYEET